MTEDEAKTKACCGPRNNAETSENSDILCIASACMAWRTAPTNGPRFAVTLDDRPEEIWNWDPIEAGHYAGRVKVRHLDAQHDGFCGLAGVPHA